MKTENEYVFARPDCPSCMDMTGEDRKHDRDRGCFNCPTCGGTV